MQTRWKVYLALGFIIAGLVACCATWNMDADAQVHAEWPRSGYRISICASLDVSGCGDCTTSDMLRAPQNFQFAEFRAWPANKAAAGDELRVAFYDAAGECATWGTLAVASANVNPYIWPVACDSIEIGVGSAGGHWYYCAFGVYANGAGSTSYDWPDSYDDTVGGAELW